MQQAGADLIKLAVMPKCDEDVVELLKVTWEMKIRHPDTPVISNFHGEEGSIKSAGRRAFWFLCDILELMISVCARSDFSGRAV